METEEIEKILDRIQEWIKSADQKVSIFLAFQGVVAIFFISQIQPNFLSSFENYKCLTLSVVLFITSLFLLFFSCYKSISVIIPRLSKKGGQSITYFGDIASMQLSEYKKLLKESDNIKYQDELLNQIHISAKIAKNKYEQFREAIIIFCVGIILLLVQLIISF